MSAVTNKGITLVVLLSIAALGNGCVRPSNVLEHNETPITTERVLISSNIPIQYGRVVTRTEGLILHAQVELENTSRGEQSFEYRWEWTDAQGFQLGDTLSSWQPGFIGGKDRKLLSGVGPGPGAVNFRLSIRKPGS
jgi:uncharacterized protein YcfL